MPFVTVPDGTHLYYETLGEGEPLLLVNGQGQDHTSWDGIRDDFTGRYRVIVYDPRGTGQSDKPTEPPYSTRGFAQDAVALLDHLGIARAHVYGYSMGGRICQWLGIDHRERIGALVLSATTPGSVHGVPRAAEVNARWTNPPGSLQEAIETIAPLFFSPAWIAAHMEVVKAMFQALTPSRARTQTAFPGQCGTRLLGILPTINAPTLIIHGDEDQLAPTANASLLAERIPGAELSLIKGGRHGYLVECREEVNRVVNDFLARHPL